MIHLKLLLSNLINCSCSVVGKFILLVTDLYLCEVRLNPVYMMAVWKGTSLDEIRDTLDATAQDLNSFKIFVLCIGQADVCLTMSEFVKSRMRL